MSMGLLKVSSHPMLNLLGYIYRRFSGEGCCFGRQILVVIEFIHHVMKFLFVAVTIHNIPLARISELEVKCADIARHIADIRVIHCSISYDDTSV